ADPAAGIVLINTGGLTITTVDGIGGVTGVGNISVRAASPITVNAPVNATGGATLIAGASNSSNAADILTINANVSGRSVVLNGNSLVVNAATVSAPGGIFGDF